VSTPFLGGWWRAGLSDKKERSTRAVTNQRYHAGRGGAVLARLTDRLLGRSPARRPCIDLTQTHKLLHQPRDESRAPSRSSVIDTSPSQCRALHHALSCLIRRSPSRSAYKPTARAEKGAIDGNFFVGDLYSLISVYPDLIHSDAHILSMCKIILLRG